MNKILYQRDLNRKPKLSIVIPTFDRNDNLEKLLTHIANEKSLNLIEIIILDNCSPTILPNQFFDKLFLNTQIKYLQNNFHLGPDANYLKSIELSQTDWVYPLGDSKIPVQGFLDILLQDIESFSDSFGIVYKYASDIEQDEKIHQFDRIANKNIHIGDFFLGGNSLLSKKSISENIHMASQLTLTRMPHSSFHLIPLLNNQQIILRKDPIIETFVPKPTHYNPQLSYLECLAQFALIDVITNDWKSRKILNKKIFQVYGESWRIVYHILKFTFKHKVDVSSNLHRILKYRFIFGYGLLSFLIIYFLYLLTRLLKLVNYVK